MFRTRDFILIFTTILFLVSAIGVTLADRYLGGGEGGFALPLFVETEEIEYGAESYTPPEVKRGERLAIMRQKIAASGQFASVVETEEVEEAEETVATTTETEEAEEVAVIDGVQICPQYSEYTGFWSPAGVKMDVSEGARIIFKEVEFKTEVGSSTASSGPKYVTKIGRDVMLQLPVRNFPTPGVQCLSSDVIGIAKDGSLIRNNEIPLYGVFSSATVIGYSLDGFPIHGTATFATDECGGAIVNGQYGYYISAERETIINCFSSIPINI
jgi:hypothetical protein